MLLLCHVTHPSHSPNTHSRATPPTHPLITLSLPLFATPPSYYPLLSLLPLILIPRQVDGVHRTLPNHRHVAEETKGVDKLAVLANIMERHKLKVHLYLGLLCSCPIPHNSYPCHVLYPIYCLMVLANIMERHKLKVHLYLGLLCTLSIVLWSWPISWKDTNSR